MLRPFLIIGVGGSGGKTLRGLRHALELRLQQAGWAGGLPSAWQMLHIDTPVSQDGTDYVLPFLPPENYLGLVSAGSSFEIVHGSLVLGKKIAESSLNDVKRQLPDPSRVPVTVTKGAGQYRAVGRTVALSKLAEISRAAAQAINRMTDANSLGQLETLGELLGANAQRGRKSPTVIVASSIAGGSGAGQYLDVIEAIKAAAKGEDWAHSFFSILYAPDVFDQIKGSAAIPSNALAAITETMNGFWTRDPSPSTVELFKSRGLQPSYGGARDRVGAAYPFIVGRQNSKVSFANQGEVYSAVAVSIAAWMTDDKVQGDIDEYAMTNLEAQTDALEDNTRLMRRGDQRPPFSSIGFGRVSLGREKFLDYAAERFARSTIDQILYAHIESDPALKQRTEHEWTEHKATQVAEAFIKETGLDEETERRNDVIDALRATAQLGSLKAEFRRDVLDAAAVGLDKAGGLEAGQWSDRLLTRYQANLDRYLEQDTGNRRVKLADWIRHQPQHILRTVEASIADRGLPVTVELLIRLSRAVKAATEGLLTEAETHRGWVVRLPGLVSEALAEAPDPDHIRPDSDALETALDRVIQGFEWLSEAGLRESAARLLVEVRDDFLDPLRRTLVESHEALRGRVTEGVGPDGLISDYDSWPTKAGTRVPRKYEPAPNERLLVELSDYPAEFNRLVNATSSENSPDNAMLDVMSKILVGSVEETASGSEGWRLIRNPRTWQPQVTASSSERVATTRLPRFIFETDPTAYVARANQWMRRPGTAFQAYITEDLRRHFDAEHLGPLEYKQRVDKYKEQFLAALGSSEPLVKLNPKLLAAVHGKALGDGVRTIFSSIPFAKGTDLYEVTRGVLAAQGMWDDNVSPGWFKDVPAVHIEIFAMQGFPYAPIVMDSVMAPIASAWMRESNSPDSRAAFWKWKRSRLLRESAPVSPEVFDSMVRGWYVAKSLGFLAVESGDIARGPQLRVWDVEQQNHAGFPHPLLHDGSAPPQDFIGVVMESLSIALALCNSDSSLRPLRAYHQLLDLGGTGRQLSLTLSDWIQLGTIPVGAAAPAENRAGAAAGTWQARKLAIGGFLTKERADFDKDVAKQDPFINVFSYPVSWEIRETVLKAIGDLIDGVGETQQASTGV